MKLQLQKDQQRSSESGSVLTDSNSMMGGLGSSSNLDSFRSLLEPNGMRPRKPCNCTKSQCLKLYCDCFANGEFCHLCNCTNCFNNLNHEEDRQKVGINFSTTFKIKCFISSFDNRQLNLFWKEIQEPSDLKLVKVQ